MTLQLTYLDKYRYPVERIKGKWFINFIRLLLHTRRIQFSPFDGYIPDDEICSDIRMEENSHDQNS